MSGADGITLVSDTEAVEFQKKLAALGPDVQVLSIYGMNNRHFAWIKNQEKAESKPSKNSKNKGFVNGGIG
jgi:hypothetical protein